MKMVRRNCAFCVVLCSAVLVLATRLPVAGASDSNSNNEDFEFFASNGTTHTFYPRFDGNVTNVVCHANSQDQVFQREDFIQRSWVNLPFSRSQATSTRTGTLYQLNESSRWSSVSPFSYRLVATHFRAGGIFRCGSTRIFLVHGNPVSEIIHATDNGENGLTPGRHNFSVGSTSIPPFICYIYSGEPRSGTLQATIAFRNGTTLNFRPYETTFRFPISGSRDSAGKYTCRAANQFNTENRTLEVSVDIRYRPDFSGSQDRVVVALGGNLTIVCSVSSFPEMTGFSVRRFSKPYENKVVEDTFLLNDALEQYRGQDPRTRRQIAVQIPFRPEDNGKVYECVGQNSEGLGEHPIELAVVEQPPSAPSQLTIENVQTTSDVLLKWDHTSSQEDLVDKFHVVCSHVTRGSNAGPQLSVTVSGSQDSAVVSGLYPGELYICNLTASNPVGISPAISAQVMTTEGKPCLAQFAQNLSVPGLAFNLMLPCSGGDEQSFQVAISRVPAGSSLVVRPVFRQQISLVDTAALTSASSYAYQVTVSNSFGRRVTILRDVRPVPPASAPPASDSDSDSDSDLVSPANNAKKSASSTTAVIIAVGCVVGVAAIMGVVLVLRLYVFKPKKRVPIQGDASWMEIANSKSLTPAITSP